MNNLENKYGKYAVSGLSLKLVVLYVIGYVLYYTMPGIFALLTLDVTALLNGQIWRVVSWLLVPPDGGSNLFFVAIMLFFYYSIGTSLERVWGDFKYNVFIFLGIFLTVLSALAWYVLVRLTGGLTPVELAVLSKSAAPFFSTYYINMSIFLAFALTFPEAQVYLFFVLPLKVKYLGWVDVGFLLLSMVTGNSAERFVIGAALLNVLLLFMRSRNWMSYSPGQVIRSTREKRAQPVRSPCTGAQSAAARKKMTTHLNSATVRNVRVGSSTVRTTCLSIPM